MSGRRKALRRARRTFWRMVVWRSPGASLSRRLSLGLAFHEARCGLITGGEHSWGPLVYEYEGQRRRKQLCRWCGAKQTPAGEFARTMPSAKELADLRAHAGVPTEADLQAALKAAEAAGLVRNGKWPWD